MHNSLVGIRIAAIGPGSRFNKGEWTMTRPLSKSTIHAVGLILTLLSAGNAFAADSAVERAGVFTQQQCPMTGINLAAVEHPVRATFDGRDINFCSEKCPSEFKANLAKNLELLDKSIIDAQLPLYPKRGCIVDGASLPVAPDAAVSFVYGNLLVRLRSQECKARFNASPEQYLRGLESRVIAQQLPDYPLDVCVVSGDKLSGKDAMPVNYVLGHRLIRFCKRCDEYCAPRVLENPARYFRLIDIARTDPNFPPKAHQGFHTLEKLSHDAKSKASDDPSS